MNIPNNNGIDNSYYKIILTILYIITYYLAFYYYHYSFFINAIDNNNDYNIIPYINSNDDTHYDPIIHVHIINSNKYSDNKKYE